MSMNDEPQQRWNRVPDPEGTARWPVRRELVHWRRGDRERVRAFFARQPGDGLPAWVQARHDAYGAAYPGVPASTAHDEALLDLLCWQRQEPSPRRALDWLRDWEIGVAQVEGNG